MRRAQRTRVAAAVVVATAVAVLVSGCSSASSTTSPPESTATVTVTPGPAIADGPATITVGGVERTFVVRTPDGGGSRGAASGGASESSSDERLPVIIALHGVGGSGSDFERYTGLTDAAGDHMMVVYPDGLPVPDGRRVWNAGDCCNPANTVPTDDIGFLRALIEELRDRGADTEQVYLAGFSNGGMLAYRAACEMGESIAGIAVIAGALTVDDCGNGEAAPVPLLVIHGMEDTIVPFDGGPLSAGVDEGLEGVEFRSVQESVAVWRDRNGCAASPAHSTIGSADVAQYSECAVRGDITVVALPDGEHTWVATDGSFDATPVILNTFGL
jgi:polyhydroxybutyrate depolymerase